MKRNELTQKEQDQIRKQVDEEFEILVKKHGRDYARKAALVTGMKYLASGHLLLAIGAGAGKVESEEENE
jgi:hypothetical protein